MKSFIIKFIIIAESLSPLECIDGATYSSSLKLFSIDFPIWGEEQTNGNHKPTDRTMTRWKCRNKNVKCAIKLRFSSVFSFPFSLNANRNEIRTLWMWRWRYMMVLAIKRCERATYLSHHYCSEHICCETLVWSLFFSLWWWTWIARSSFIVNIRHDCLYRHLFCECYTVAQMEYWYVQIFKRPTTSMTSWWFRANKWL